MIIYDRISLPHFSSSLFLHLQNQDLLLSACSDAKITAALSSGHDAARLLAISGGMSISDRKYPDQDLIRSFFSKHKPISPPLLHSLNQAELAALHLPAAKPTKSTDTHLRLQASFDSEQPDSSSDEEDSTAAHASDIVHPVPDIAPIMDVLDLVTEQNDETPNSKNNAKRSKRVGFPWLAPVSKTAPPIHVDTVILKRGMLLYFSNFDL